MTDSPRARIDAPVVLTGDVVRLEPLELGHATELRAAAAEPHERVWYTVIPTPETVLEDVENRLRLRDQGRMNPFAIRRLADGQVVGETTFCNFDVDLPRTEVGYTWLAPSAQRSGVNSETKLLMFEHAFDTCEVIAVELRAHFHNHRSREAILRLGAKQDGILRNHRLGPDGTLRDTVVFSVLPHEWPTVRTGLRARLRQ